MPNPIGAAAQLTGQALRFGWYLGLNRLIEWQAQRINPTPRPRPAVTRPVPSRNDILADLAQLFMRDAQAVRDGIYPPIIGEEGPLENLQRARAMLMDLPQALSRREARDATTAKSNAAGQPLPEYYVQDFHYQTGGYLTEDSARLYDMQVETLFLGGAAAMRREALRPLAEFMRGRDQRRVVLLDVGCGTGRLLRQLRLVWPAMQLKGLDLSRAYLDEAARHMDGLRAAELIEAPAERMPLADASVNIVCSTFVYHELPPDVRRHVTAETARVLVPGGLFVFLDSLQLGDRPDWDGLLEAFPVRFHEPYYRHYASDDLDSLFAEAGLVTQTSWTSHLCKVMVRRKS